MSHGMRLPGGSNRATELAGIDAVRSLFHSADLIYQDIPNENDIGKDAYVDLPEGGQFVGDLIALQIKSGVSYRLRKDYKIPCDAKHLALWRGSSIPIYGIVHDPEFRTLHWAELTGWARSLPSGKRPSFCPVPNANVLDAQTLPEWVAIARRHVRARAQAASILELVGDDATRQEAAAFDCFALGRSDPRPLKLLRASLRWLDEEVLPPAIQILSLMTAHPDVLWTTTTWLPQRVQKDVYKTFQWDLDEASLLIRAPGAELWGRGELGQSVYMLLVADLRHEVLLEQVAAMTYDTDVAWHAALLRVALAEENGLAALEGLAAKRPALRYHHLYDELRLTLTDHGHVSLF